MKSKWFILGFIVGIIAYMLYLNFQWKPIGSKVDGSTLEFNMITETYR